MPQKPCSNSKPVDSKSAMGAKRKESSRGKFTTFDSSDLAIASYDSFNSKQSFFFACKLPFGPVQNRPSATDKKAMNYQQLDAIFPYVMFAYGALITFVLNSEKLMEIAEQRMPFYYRERLIGAQVLAQLSLWLGGLWILQNIWLA